MNSTDTAEKSDLEAREDVAVVPQSLHALMRRHVVVLDVLEAARALPDALRALCAGLAPHYRLLVDSFGIPDYLVASPIAADWSLYNEGDNRGEVLGVPF